MVQLNLWFSLLEWSTCNLASAASPPDHARSRFPSAVLRLKFPRNFFTLLHTFDATLVGSGTSFSCYLLNVPCLPSAVLPLKRTACVTLGSMVEVAICGFDG
ncbi:hypothetical protein EDD16DRAFT_1546313 [Pisolithus croceorrhizus]|nr:hypothetical protein EV401DRAFT_1947468 [Pisolithus croceorrhizus]KAI6128963.1 hypothetical protein EDD16DRAFT_1546313 [Pisolithus croceorrhizus]KAI6162366.1 hypothetical protein EDD17DRAFT_1577204 [Pisolithus thermaeus]